MRILIIFRGWNVRVRDGVPQNALNCVDNWNNAIFNNLKDNNIDYDIAFFTYTTPTLDELVNKMKPVKVVKEGYTDQYGCLEAATQYMLDHKEAYDRVLLLRFDFKYRIRVTQWKKWDEKGIILVNRDVHWLMPSRRYGADIVFIVDQDSIETFYKAIRHPRRLHAHTVATYLDAHKIPFHFMYDTYHHMTTNPLHAHDQFESEPNLDETYTPFFIDITEFWRIRGINIHTVQNY